MSCQKNLVSVLALERLELPLDLTQPVICLQGVAGSCKGGWLGPQESCQLVIHGLLSLPLVDKGIGQGFHYEGLIAYCLCQVLERWRWWQWHFSLISSSVLAHFLFFLRRVLSIGCPPAPAAAGVRLWEPLESRQEAICRSGRVFVRLGLGLSDI